MITNYNKMFRISLERYNSLDRINYRNISDDDNRDKLLVILAGYTDDMDRFLDINPSLKSRFANIIEFKDYSVDDLSNIADSLFKNKGYVISKEARLKKLLKFLILEMVDM